MVVKRSPERPIPASAVGEGSGIVMISPQVVAMRISSRVLLVFSKRIWSNAICPVVPTKVAMLDA